MTTEVDKITNAPTQNELIDKVNEIIDNLGSGGITVDTALSTTSENPVQNKVITDALDGKSNISNTVTTDTAQDITGTKSFVGGNKLILKQDTDTSRPGFIIANPNAKEVGSLQYRPNAIGTNAMLNLDSPGNTYLGFRYWGTPSDTYNLLMPLPSNANTYFPAGNYYFPLGFTDGTNTVSTGNTGMVDISTFLSDFVSTGSLATTLTDYVRFTDLSTVATTGDFDDLINIPTLKTINNNSIIGSGNITIDSLPSQAGNNGKFLTTNGTTASWSSLPSDIFIATYSITSYNDIMDAYNNGKVVLCIKYSTIGNNPVIYYMSGQSVNGSRSYINFCRCDSVGIKTLLLTHNSSSDTWSNYTYSIPTATSDLTNDSGFITSVTSSDVTNALGYIPYNSSNPNGYTSNTGTVTSVNNVSPVNGNVSLTIPTVDQSFDGTSVNAESGVSILGLLQTIYPVGSIYLSTNATCPLASLFGTWSLVSSGKALWTGTGSNGGYTLSAGLPNITGGVNNVAFDSYATSNVYGAFNSITDVNNATSGSSSSERHCNITFNASNSSSIYGNSTTVQPPAYVVNVWRRTA